jgi:hypothetical protein
MRRHDDTATQQRGEQADNQQFGFHVELRDGFIGLERRKNRRP